MGPIFCFINNIIEIRADANKFVTTLKRPTPQIAANIGKTLPLTNFSLVEYSFQSLIIHFIYSMAHKYTS